MNKFTLNSLIAIAMAAVIVAVIAMTRTDDTGAVAEVPQRETAVEHARKHMDPKYTCPMHPQIIREEPGTCPICGMDLVPVEQDEGASERKVLYYRHPHNPTITSDKPMKDEMGMDYVPIYDDGGGVSVKISPAVEQNMGVRTATVKRDRLWRRIDTVGYVGFDENRLSHVHLRVDGWIEKLAVKSEGERVSRGDVLFELYSPSLVTAQEEYLQAIAGTSERLVKASAERLTSLGVAPAQIARLKEKREVQRILKVFAPQDGIVATLNVREGMYVKPATEVMMLADLSSVWLLAEVFERQVDWVRVGQWADVRLAYLPGQLWEGKVEYIYPKLDPKTRTLKVRVRFDNPGEVLKPNMFADVTLYGGAKTDLLIIPREALIRTGSEERVIVALGDGRFAPRKVTAGIESGDEVEITEGLRSGEQVVVSGQFLIDSEASLKASIMRMSEVNAEAATMPTVTGHGELRALMPEQHALNIAHEPIEALGWPSMVMDFRLREGVDLSGLNPGDAIEFDMVEDDNGYAIWAIRKADQ